MVLAMVVLPTPPLSAPIMITIGFTDEAPNCSVELLVGFLLSATLMILA
jgi:hypothetical protein